MVYVHNINPVLVSLGPLAIRYYGLAYVLGLIFAYIILKHLIKKKLFSMTEEELEDFMLYAALGILLGARVFYFIFYNIQIVANDPLQILRIWEGGMSFHGGLIGVIVSGYLFCKKYNKDFYTLADMAVIPTALGLGFGRVANFINGELYGRATNLAWAVDFGDGISRHPSQLYEAVKNIIIFTLLWWLKDKEIKKGTLFWTFITSYGVLRFFIEFVREPDPQLGFVLLNIFTMGQVLTATMAIVGAFMLFYLYHKKKP